MERKQNNILLWLRIIRPQTLFASLCPVAIGLMIVPHVHHAIALLTIGCALSLQVLSNLINDLYDYLRGTDQQGRQGFKRALAEGEVTEKQMRIACLITLGISLATGLYLVIEGGWVILGIGVTAILFAWLYTATNHSLSYLGIADIFVYLYYGVVATTGTIWLQVYPAGETDSLFRTLLIQGWWAGSVSGICSMCVLMINNLRDRESDQAAGKKTLPVRFGKRTGEIVMGILILLAPIAAWLAFHSWISCIVVLPLLFLWLRVRKAEGAAYNKCLLMAGLCNVCYVLLVSISMIVG